MLPIAMLDNHLLMGVSQDTRPPPVEFAELFAGIVHVAHTVGKANVDTRRILGFTALAKAAKAAQVFDFGDLPETRLMGEAITGGALMGQKLLRLPYPSVLYWYTLTSLVDHEGKEKFYVNKDLVPFRGVDRVRYATLVAEAGDEFYVADFMLLDPMTAAMARAQLEASSQGTVLKELQRGRHLFLCSGVAQLTATEKGLWQGYLLDTPGSDPRDREAKSLGSLADGIAAMTMILATKGVGLRREPVPVKVNAKREKAGRPPYPSVTHVDARQYFDAMQRSALGGTHASPVPHLRRGHVRTYQDGRRTWVRSALVNCRSLEEAQTRDHYEVAV